MTDPLDLDTDDTGDGTLGELVDACEALTRTFYTQPEAVARAITDLRAALAAHDAALAQAAKEKP